MLSIGRALMGNPNLLLLDEPLEGLAPVIVEAILKVLERLIREDSLALSYSSSNPRASRSRSPTTPSS